jgi:hypothetical protein
LTFKCLTSLFEKIDSAAEMKNVPPIIWKTAYY